MKRIILSGFVVAVLMTSFVAFNTISAQKETVPSWIKTTVSFWVEGKVDDNTFLNAIQFLANQRIIEVNAESALTSVTEIYVKQKSVNTAGLTSSSNGDPDNIFCDGNDIAISGGASTSWGQIYISQLYPIAKNGVINGYAVGFWNENPDFRSGQIIYVTCLSTGDSSNASIKSYFKTIKASAQEETGLKCPSSEHQLVQYEMNATYRHFADKNANGIYCQYYSVSNDQTIYFDDK